MTDDWHSEWAEVAAQRRGGDAYGALVAAQRLLQDRVAGMALPDDLVEPVTAQLAALAASLEPFQVAERQRWDGTRADLPGRGTALLPPYVVTERGDGWLRGTVTLTRFHLGAGAAAHGGVAPLLFDDVLGHLAGMAGGVSRTAYLTVNYRAITPLDRALGFNGSIDRIEGRKRFVSGRLTGPDGTLLAEADALMIELRPGQA